MKNLISVLTLAGILACASASASFEAVSDDVATQGLGCMTDTECEATQPHVTDCDDGDCPVTDDDDSYQVWYSSRKRTMLATD